MFSASKHNAESKNNFVGNKKPFFQPKLSINQPNDVYEQEADAVAEHVMRKISPTENSKGVDTFFRPLPIQKKVIQKQGDEEEHKEGVEPIIFPLGLSGRWPGLGSGFGFDLDITHAQLNFGDPRFRQLSFGINYPAEPYLAFRTPETAFKFGYDIANEYLYEGIRIGGFDLGLQLGTGSYASQRPFGIHLGYGTSPLFNYGMRTSLQFGNTPLPYASQYINEVGNTADAFSNWEAGGTDFASRFTTLIDGVSTFGSMTGDLFKVADEGKYNWGAGVNFGFDPELQWYIVAGVNFALGGGDKKKRERKPEEVQRKCAACEHEEEEKLQRKEKNKAETEASNELENYVGGLGSSGNNLSSHTNHFFSQKIGYDFSNVKIHTDSVAAKSAQSINALAYTTGNHIVFNQNQYQPETDAGKKLLAHELTHVVQQSENISTKKIHPANKNCVLGDEAGTNKIQRQEESEEPPQCSGIYSDGRNVNNNSDHDLDKDHHERERSPDIILYDNIFGESGALSDYQIGFFGGTFFVDTSDDDVLYNHFVSGNGSRLNFNRSTDMSSIIGREESFNDFANAFEVDIMMHYAAHRTICNYDGDAFITANRPTYFNDQFFAWAVMGGYSRIEASVFSNTAGGLDVKYKIYDHYGAGVSDAWSYLLGLSAMYYLQHFHGTFGNQYTPFIWSVEIQRTIY